MDGEIEAYFRIGISEGVSVIVHPEPEAPIAQQIADAIRMRTNTIAGRPNVGNLALEFIHKGRHVPAAIVTDYVLRTLRGLLPGVLFRVTTEESLDQDGMQRISVEYAIP